MPRTVLAGCAYFAVIFAVGFALGTARILVILPNLGETAAVLIELPLILAICWGVSGYLTARMIDAGDRRGALVMGGVAFALLMVGELVLSLAVFGRSVLEHMAHWTSLAGALGLAGQLAFAAMPWIQVRRTASV